MQEVIKALNRIYEKSLENLEETKKVNALLQGLIKQNLIRLIKVTWLDGHDVIQAFHITRKALDYLRSSGKLPFTTLHEKYIYKYSDIGAILKKNYSKIKLSIKKDDE